MVGAPRNERAHMASSTASLCAAAAPCAHTCTHKCTLATGRHQAPRPKSKQHQWRHRWQAQLQQHFIFCREGLKPGTTAFTNCRCGPLTPPPPASRALAAVQVSHRRLSHLCPMAGQTPHVPHPPSTHALKLNQPSQHALLDAATPCSMLARRHRHALLNIGMRTLAEPSTHNSKGPKRTTTTNKHTHAACTLRRTTSCRSSLGTAAAASAASRTGWRSDSAISARTSSLKVALQQGAAAGAGQACSAGTWGTRQAGRGLASGII